MTILDRRTATWAERREEKERFDALLLSGKIGESTYVLSLNFLGFRDKEAKAEIASLRTLAEIERQRRLT